MPCGEGAREEGRELDPWQNGRMHLSVPASVRIKLGRTISATPGAGQALVGAWPSPQRASGEV